jgi:integrase
MIAERSRAADFLPAAMMLTHADTRSCLSPCDSNASCEKKADVAIAASQQTTPLTNKSSSTLTQAPPKDANVIHECMACAIGAAVERGLRLDGKFTRKTASNLKPIREQFGTVRAMELSADHVERYIESLLLAGKSKTTVNRRTQLLGQAYNLAIEHKRLDERPKPHIRRLSEVGNERRGFTTRRELDRIIEGLPLYLRDVVLFAFLTSWRKSEICSLRWPNVTLDTIRLSAEHSKEREARSLGLEGELREIIERRQALTDGHLVFHHNGKPIGDFRKSWATACRLAGISGLLVHDLRRSGVNDMIRAGVAPHVAMSISGHKTDSMLRRYAIISENGSAGSVAAHRREG